MTAKIILWPPYNTCACMRLCALVSMRVSMYPHAQVHARTHTQINNNIIFLAIQDNSSQDLPIPELSVMVKGSLTSNHSCLGTKSLEVVSRNVLGLRGVPAGQSLMEE